MADWLDDKLSARVRRWRLTEFVGFYLFTPVAVALLLPPSVMFSVLFAFTALGVFLLARTEGFAWRDLRRGANAIDWRFTAGFVAVTMAVATGVVLATDPGAFLVLPRENPRLMMMIALLYPLLSALPQEIVFRPLFFRRYGMLLPGLWPAIMLNAALFALAHLMFWSLTVAAMTFFGGLAFAWAYEVRRSFAMAVLLHAVAGVIVFAAGLGMFFYTGNIDRPF